MALLRRQQPAAVFGAAGELAQFMGSRQYHDTITGRQALRQCLGSAGPTCLTDAEHWPGEVLENPPIDDVCSSEPPGEVPAGSHWSGWEGTTAEALELSTIPG